MFNQLATALEEAFDSIGTSTGEVMDTLCGYKDEYLVERKLEETYLPEDFMYIQKFIPIVVSATDKTVDEAIQFIEEYKGDVFTVTTNKSVMVKVNCPYIELKPGIVPELKPVSYSKLYMGSRKQVQSIDCLNAIQAIGFNLDKDLIQLFPDDNQDILPFTKKVSLLDYANKTFYYKLWQDFRGRHYPIGFNINLYGKKFRRNIHTFALKQVLNNEGIIGCKLGLTDGLGLNKLTIPERLVKADEYLATHTLTDSMSDIVTYKHHKALTNATVPTGVMLELDATSSGPQILGLLSGCRETMTLSNVIGSQRNDLYTKFTDSMNKGRKAKLARKDVKFAVMAHCYLSTAVPKKLFKGDSEKFIAKINSDLPGVQRVIDFVLKHWTDEAKYEWTMPDGFKVCIKRYVTNTVTWEINGTEFKYDYSVNQADDNYRHILANIVQSIDGYMARCVVNKLADMNIECFTIHDAYLVHPNHNEALRNVYREVLAEISQMDLLGRIMTEITGRKLKFHSNDESLTTEINQSVHALC